MKPIIAIVGRPNVGKSTLFNRITRTTNAIVDDQPGVTRDRHYGDAKWEGVEFTLIDTGGFTDDTADTFSNLIRQQVNLAIDDADAIILVMDGKSGISPYDADILNHLRPVSLPVFYVVNKTDGVEKEELLYEFHRLGIEKLYPVSGAHGYGVPDLLDDVIAALPEREPEPPVDMLHLAVVGRPNVGKSSLINKLLGEERLLVSDVPGTTRDSVDSLCQINGKSYILVDTAGIRRKKKGGDKLEKFSIIKSLRSLDRCDVALILLDASEGITDQDIKVAGHAYERGCGCIFLLNKWDIVEKGRGAQKKYIDQLRMESKYLSFAPALTISALTGLGLSKIFAQVDEVYRQYSVRITTGQLNKIIEQATQKNEPPLHKGKRIKFYYSSQVSTKPPTFVCFVNYPQAVHFSYERYLINQIRESAGLDKTPIRVLLRQRTGKIEFGLKRRNSRKKTK